MANNSANSRTNTSTNDSLNGSSNGSDNGVATRPSSLDEALRVLDDALAGQGTRLKELVTNDYANLKTALNSMAGETMGRLGEFGGNLSGNLENFKGMSEEVYGQTLEASREIAQRVDRSVKSNPWPVIGGVAVGTFALGLLLGRSGETGSNTTSR